MDFDSLLQYFLEWLPSMHGQFHLEIALLFFFIRQFKVSISFNGGLEKESGKTAIGVSHIFVFFVLFICFLCLVS